MKGPDAPVVVGVDGSSSALAAVKWAADDCARHHTPLRLVHGYSLPVRGYPEIIMTGNEIRKAIEDQAHGWRVRRDVARVDEPGARLPLAAPAGDRPARRVRVPHLVAR